MLSILLAAAEPSKTAWYIAGSVLAVYAVVLSTIGLARVKFPFSERGARGVMALSLLLAGLAIAMAIVSS
jgi:hypothetical protein